MAKRRIKVQEDVDLMLRLTDCKGDKNFQFKLNVLAATMLAVLHGFDRLGTNFRLEKNFSNNLCLNVHYWSVHGSHYEIEVWHENTKVFQAYYNAIIGVSISLFIPGSWAKTLANSEFIREFHAGKVVVRKELPN